MLSLVAIALAVATPSPALDASAPWWEKITKIMDGDGTERACKYETSMAPQAAESCDVEASRRGAVRATRGRGFTQKLIFERRFSPGGRPDSGRLQPGDILLTRHVMFLTIDQAGAVQSCRVVAAVGDVASDYGCKEAKAERFQARAGETTQPTRQAFMTVLVYGHTEHIA